MKKYLFGLFLFIACFCVFVSCSDDDLTLEEMKQALVGEWELMDPPTEFYYMEYYIFNSDGTAQMITEHENSMGKQINEVTLNYRLEKEEGSDNLHLYFTNDDMEDFRYIEEFSSRKISMRLGILTCDSPKYYKKVK